MQLSKWKNPKASRSQSSKADFKALSVTASLSARPHSISALDVSMRSIARQSTRLVNQSQASSCTRATTQPLVRRSFHCTPNRPQDWRPPNGGLPEHANSFHEDQRRTEDGGPTKTDQAQTAENGDAKAAADARKFGGRKKTRRLQEVPKPPPIPQWFLKHNVKLVDDGPLVRDGQKKRKVVRCVDADTGHVLFTVPYYQLEPLELESPPKSPEDGKDGSGEGTTPLELERARQEVEADTGVSEESWKRLKEETALMDKRTKELLKIGESLRAAADRMKRAKRGDAEESKDGPVEPALKQSFFDQKFPSDVQISGQKERSKIDNLHSETTDENAAVDDLLEKESPATNALHHNYDHMRPSAYSFLEAELSIRAGLSLLSDDHIPLSSFAATRVDLSLTCSDSEQHDRMDAFIETLGDAVAADIIRLDANDFEELTNEYVSQGDDAPGSFTNLAFDVFDGYSVSALNSSFEPPSRQEDEIDEDEDDFDDEEDTSDSASSGRNGPFRDLRRYLGPDIRGMTDMMSKALEGAGIPGIKMGAPIIVAHRHPSSGDRPRPPAPRPVAPSSKPASDYFQWDDARLGALLDSLLDAPRVKRASENSYYEPRMSSTMNITDKVNSYVTSTLKLQSENFARRWHAAVAQSILNYTSWPDAKVRLDVTTEEDRLAHSENSTDATLARRRTLIHIRDLKEICERSRVGDALVRRLVKTVVKRRKSGEDVLIVGTSASEDVEFFGSFGDPEDFPFRSISIPPFTPKAAVKDQNSEFGGANLISQQESYSRILEINLRHIQSMMRRLRPGTALNFFEAGTKDRRAVLGTQGLSQRVLTFDQVQRLVLMAVGLSKSHAQSYDVTSMHIMMATFVAARVDRIQRQLKSQRAESRVKANKLPDSFVNGFSGDGKTKDDKGNKSKVEEIRPSCNPHETRLLAGVVDAKNIKTGFADVHVPPETIEALKTLTTLSLVRPEAFKYGVLANDRLPGLLLYGPPGTGKTLLAKAVAKESQATVMEVSGAQIYEKYVGEGEKMVRAVFSLAKKLSPCIVFLDEADSIFGSRGGGSGNRNTHREIINQFLREWDGMDDHGVFMMVASNRPFDLDDAVLRRLPRRLLVDLPVAKDRESILNIHLKAETLSPDVSLSNIAARTPLYSGSDLKNLCVSTALACVREENEMVLADPKIKLPEKRTLLPRHFETATQEISASISEDMSSLTAIRKFDEQFGDRRGRRKKSGFGFGGTEGAVDESAARVRQAPVPGVEVPGPTTPPPTPDSSSPPPPPSAPPAA